MQYLDLFTNNDWLKGTFWGKRVHSKLIVMQNLKFIYGDTSAASAEFLMSVHLSLSLGSYLWPDFPVAKYHLDLHYAYKFDCILKIMLFICFACKSITWGKLTFTDKTLYKSFFLFLEN